MAIITKSSPIAKDAPITFTLNKSALAALPIVAASSWYSDVNNWNKVIISYKSTVENERIVVTFDGQDLSPQGSFLAVTPSLDVFNVVSMYIVDFNNGTFNIPASSLNQSEFAVDFGVVPPFFLRDFSAQNSILPTETTNFSIASNSDIPNCPFEYSLRSPNINYISYIIDLAQMGVTIVQGQQYRVRLTFLYAAPVPNYNRWAAFAFGQNNGNYMVIADMPALAASVGSEYEVILNAATSDRNLFCITQQGNPYDCYIGIAKYSIEPV